MDGRRIQPGTSTGGAMVVTVFACRTRRDLLLVWWLHHRLRSAVRARARGFLGVRLFLDRRQRIIRSVSLWSDPAYLYDMGEVPEHVAATRVPARRGIRTSCGVYTYQGGWQAVMFGMEADSAPPLSEQIRQELEIASERGS